jgi:hypothetical protein
LISKNRAWILGILIGVLINGTVMYSMSLDVLPQESWMDFIILASIASVTAAVMTRLLLGKEGQPI